MIGFPEIKHEAFRAFLNTADMAQVVAAPEGRFILPVPDFKDGRGPLLLPNIKELEARLRGSTGHVAAIELEAGPQKIPTDGTNVIVINRVDEFVQLALKAKLAALIKKHGRAREAVEEFISYARGYKYDPENKTITFAKSAGFHNDVYNMPAEEFKRRYASYENPTQSLEDAQENTITPGYYVKKPLHSRAVFVSGRFAVRVSAGAGDTIQEFENGAMLNLPDDPELPLSFVHPTDIDISYRKPDGTPLTDAKGALSLPVVSAADIAMSQQKRARPGPRTAVT